MSDAEIISKVEAATAAFEEIPFRELVELMSRTSPRIAAAFRPSLVQANQTLRFALESITKTPK